MILKKSIIAGLVFCFMMLSISCSALDKQLTVQVQQTTKAQTETQSQTITEALPYNSDISQNGNNETTGELAAVTTDEGFIVPALPCSPTDHSVIINVVPEQETELYVEYGTQSAEYSSHTSPVTAQGGEPFEVSISGLSSDTKYYFRVVFKAQDGGNYLATQESSFVTQRSAGSDFTFCIQGDSHPERTKQFDSDLYLQTMENVCADNPDFYMTIGDDFSVDEMDTITQQAVEQLYVNQRKYFSLVSTPVFLVNGNHEKEAEYILDGTPDNTAVWGCNARNAYFSQPVPDDFYTGDIEEVEYIGLLRDYYAFTWGDALFVVIDPYWHSSADALESRNMWDMTLGDEQYEWLKQTLEQSAAKYKFVFAHHLTADRGGTDVVDLFEWGGYNRLGKWQFDKMRPDWDMPIHQLMVETGVTVFFQGHDHLFAVQEKDGVTYQTLPMPSRSKQMAEFAEYYDSDVLFTDSGYVRVSVSTENITVDYIASVLPEDETGEYHNGEIVYSYTLEPH